MVTKNQVLATAASQIGVVESPFGSNRQKYGAWYGMNGAPWCDMFISWVFGMIPGGSGAIGGKYAYCPYHLGWFQRNGRLFRSPAVGDIVFYRFPGMDVTGHIGIVERVLSGGRIQTIEGNTSANGSQNNGGGVCRKIRSSSAYISGYGRPYYSTITSTPSHPSRGSSRPPIGSRSVSQVKYIQWAVHVTADGRWGPSTQAASIAVIRRSLGNVRYLQARVGAVQDGRWGPRSEALRITAVKRIQTALHVTADGTWGPRTNTAWSRAYNANYGR